MKKRIMYIIFVILLLVSLLTACGQSNKTPKIGVSFGVGKAARWGHEIEYMEAHAKELGVEMDTRLNYGDGETTQIEDCKELIDSGIDTLILTSRNADDVPEILSYAKKKGVPVVNYARVVLGEKVDLFVGYDCGRIGQRMGQYISEAAHTGDYILLKGDPNDNNAVLLYDGAMQYIDPIRDNINVILDAEVTGWEPELAKQLVYDAVKANGGKIDAILAPNDTVAGACAEALKELGVSNHVVITGMDAEIDAAKRIAAGTQDMTVYMDLKDLATTAVDEAVRMAKGEELEVNAEFDNKSGKTIDAHLITGQLVTKENMDKILIDSGYFTKDEIYGE